MYYGSKEWANDTLRYGIQICKGKYTYGVLGNRIFEVKYYVKILEEKGFWWQSMILKKNIITLMNNHKGVTKQVKTKPEPKPKREFDFSKPNAFNEFLNWLYDTNVT